jgi:hypothetical protein
MSYWVNTAISMLRRAARACSVRRVRGFEDAAPLARRGMPRALACARMVGSLLLERSPNRWAFSFVVCAPPPRSAQDLCVLG